MSGFFVLFWVFSVVKWVSESGCFRVVVFSEGDVGYVFRGRRAMFGGISGCYIWDC